MIRKYLHERGTAGFGQPAICTHGLVSTWVCFGSLRELGELRSKPVEGGAARLIAAVAFGSCPGTSFCLGLVLSS